MLCGYHTANPQATLGKQMGRYLHFIRGRKTNALWSVRPTAQAPNTWVFWAGHSSECDTHDNHCPALFSHVLQLLKFFCNLGRLWKLFMLFPNPGENTRLQQMSLHLGILRNFLPCSVSIDGRGAPEPRLGQFGTSRTEEEESCTAKVVLPVKSGRNSEHLACSTTQWVGR